MNPVIFFSLYLLDLTAAGSLAQLSVIETLQRELVTHSGAKSLADSPGRGSSVCLALCELCPSCYSAMEQSHSFPLHSAAPCAVDMRPTRTSGRSGEELKIRSGFTVYKGTVNIFQCKSQHI